MEGESLQRRGGGAGIFIILVLLLGGAFWVASKEFNTPAPTVLVPDEATFYYSTSSPVRISFSYPTTYFLEERELGNGERGHSQIMLTEDTEENRLVREGLSPGRDGPVAISIDVIDNEFEQLSLYDWLLSDNRSNFKLSPTGSVSSTTQSGLPALSYHWSGLYEADSVVFSSTNHIILLTVTYITPEDDIRRIFSENILNSIVLSR